MVSESATLEPVLLSGTSSEYLGRKPLPRALRIRPVIVLAGPPGVGKTTVARRIAGEDALLLDGNALHRATVERVRRQAWSGPFLEAERLILDGPVFLSRRPGATLAIRELIRRRAELRRITVLCEGSPRDGSVGLLMDAVGPELRATVTLRFPVGRGRLRITRHICQSVGVEPRLATGVARMEPWSYQSALEAVRALATQQAGHHQP